MRNEGGYRDWIHQKIEMKVGIETSSSNANLNSIPTFISIFQWIKFLYPPSFLVDQALYFKSPYNCWLKITEAVSQSGTRLDLSMPQWKSAPQFENKIGRSQSQTISKLISGNSEQSSNMEYHERIIKKMHLVFNCMVFLTITYQTNNHSVLRILLDNNKCGLFMILFQGLI